jgi:hypothetical protein
MKNKKSLVDIVLGIIIFLVFFLMILKMTGLYEPFIKTIGYLPDFLKDIGNSWKAGLK